MYLFRLQKIFSMENINISLNMKFFKNITITIKLCQLGDDCGKIGSIYIQMINTTGTLYAQFAHRDCWIYRNLEHSHDNDA